MKVSELSGALLDYWVGRADAGDGFVGRIAQYTDGEAYCVVPCGTRGEHGWTDQRKYQPSSDWATGGPIIELERIIVGTLQRMADNGLWTHLHWTGRAYHPNNRWNDYAPGFAGDTPLVAAMRAYVASKFGEEVPDEVPA